MSLGSCGTSFETALGGRRAGVRPPVGSSDPIDFAALAFYNGAPGSADGDLAGAPVPTCGPEGRAPPTPA